MVSCKHCATPNSLDSTFCKKCGTPLPDEDLKEATEKLSAVVAEGVGLFNAGRYDEAMDVAEAAVLSNPASIAAVALKGDCHAHRGEIAEAIECYEQIVAINPESTLDKIRLNQLRNTLVLGAGGGRPDRRLATVGAVAAVVLVVSLSALVARLRAPEPMPDPIIAAANQPETPAERAEFYQQTAQSQNPTGNQQAQQVQQTQQAPPPQVSNGGNEMPLPRPPRGTGLPRVEEGISGDLELAPVQPPLNGNIGSFPPPRNGQTPPLPPARKGGDEDPQVDRQMASNEPDREPVDTGEYNISVSSGKGNSSGSTPTQGSATGAEALVRVARQQYQLGNYSSAATAYEKALGSGGDPISINQRLGQAYERLGRTGDAATAYQRAVTSIESAISSGRGDRARLQATLDSCRQALRVLQGG